MSQQAALAQTLPIPATPFIGRCSEISELIECLEDPTSRLLTLVGPGGMGKTRLSNEATRQFIEQDGSAATSRFPHGIFFIPLAPLSSVDNVVATIADVIGISETDLPHIFERFYRVDKARSERGRAGLGLAITKKIIDAHNGQIEVVSSLGEGSTFSVRIPLTTSP